MHRRQGKPSARGGRKATELFELAGLPNQEHVQLPDTSLGLAEFERMPSARPEGAHGSSIILGGRTRLAKLAAATEREPLQDRVAARLPASDLPDRGPKGQPVSRVGVIGIGHVGLPTAACLAVLGHEVVGADVDRAKVESLNAGVPTVHEEGLAGILQTALSAGRLSFVVDATDAVKDAEFVFLCLPTPQGSDGSADLTVVLEMAEEIGPHLSPGSVVVDKSTVPVGTSRLVATRLGRDDIRVVSNPEFLREGAAVYDFMHAERVVIGADDPEVAHAVGHLYEGTNALTITATPESAELAKYAANAFLATRLSFVNEIAGLCELLGADIEEVLAAIGTDGRIGTRFLEPGPGWGGSCFPKDISALLHIARQNEYNFGLLEEVMASNQRQHKRVTDMVAREIGRSIEGCVVAIWGLTFKAQTADLRKSPALDIARRLANRGAIIRGYDPMVSHEIPGITICTDAYMACHDASVILVATEWPEFAQLDFEKAGAVMARRAIVDGRNILDPALVRHAGFTLARIGHAPMGTARVAEVVAVAAGEGQAA